MQKSSSQFSCNHVGEYIYGPSSNEAAATIQQLTKSFCREYKINQDAIGAGKSGIVIGRYPGDHYAGGNPWQLLTAVLGETFYLGAQATLQKIEEKGLSDFVLDIEENKEWIKLLDTYKGTFLSASKLWISALFPNLVAEEMMDKGVEALIYWVFLR